MLWYVAYIVACVIDFYRATTLFTLSKGAKDIKSLSIDISSDIYKSYQNKD